MPFINGQRVLDPNDPTHKIWLIDSGFRRFVDNPVNVNLFTDMIGVISDTSINTVPIGLPVPTSASLQNGNGTNVVFLVESQRCRRTILNGTVFSRWRFNPAHVTVVDTGALLDIPSGPDIT